MRFSVIFISLVAIIPIATSMPAFAVTHHNDLAVRPGYQEVWVLTRPDLVEVYDIQTVNLVNTFAVGGVPDAIIFDDNGSHFYIVTNYPDDRQSFLRCFEANNGLLVSESPVGGIGLNAIVHSNGDVYVTSQGGGGQGIIARFSPVSLNLLSSGTTQSWAEAICESEFDGSILVGGFNREYEGGEMSSEIIAHDPINLSTLHEYKYGIDPIDLLSVNELLVVEYKGIPIDFPESENYVHGLSIIDEQAGTEMFPWLTNPDIVRGSCYEPINEKWFGFSFQPDTNSNGKLWMICDLSNPRPVLLTEFQSNRIWVMVAVPLGSDSIRLFGIDSENEDLFYYDTLGDYPPEAEFSANPNTDPSPLQVIIIKGYPTQAE